jgi:hypothetical protein
MNAPPPMLLQPTIAIRLAAAAANSNPALVLRMSSSANETFADHKPASTCRLRTAHANTR